MMENQQVEWKESWRDEHLLSICGLANVKGGVLEIGRNNQGQPVGLNQAAKLIEDLGIQRVFQACAEHGCPVPLFLPETSVLMVTLPFAVAPVRPHTDAATEKTRENIVELIAQHPAITTAQRANEMGLTRKGIEWQVHRLKRDGTIKRVGPHRRGHWEVASDE